MTCDRVGELLAQGRTEQLEKVVAEFRSKPVLRGNQSREAFYLCLVQSIGYHWALLEEEPASAEIMKSIDDWYKQRSQLALLCSAERHMYIGLKARGADTASTVTANDWKILESRTKLAIDELAEVLKAEKPPGCAIARYIRALQYGNFDYEDAVPWLKKYVELYPGETDAFATMSFWLLPRWGGELGESAALVAAVADRLPMPHSEVFYAQAAAGMLGQGRSVMREAGFSEVRATDAVPELLASGKASRAEIELLIEMARLAKKPLVVDQLARYHMREFGLPSKYLYHFSLIDPWFAARAQSFKPTLQN